MKFLNGYKTYIAAIGKLITAILRKAGVDVPDIVDPALDTLLMVGVGHKIEKAIKK